VPELPEVETVKLGLNQYTLGWKIIGGEVLLPRAIANPDNPAEFLSAITGLIIQNWQRRGKYLLAKLENNCGAPAGYLGVHLRMTGRLLWSDRYAPIHKHTRLRLFLLSQNTSENKSKSAIQNQEQELRFDDQRTFGKVWWVPPEREIEAVIAGLKKLGREPFNPDFTVEYLAEKLGGSSRPIKNLLLDQSTLAGIGNIYADESLFLGGIHPNTPAKQISAVQIGLLHQGIKKCLSDGISWGGTTFSDFQDIGGDKGNYLDHAWVFRRKGETCRVCQTAIERFRLGGRATHFCPKCQT
jgi:formamidopyrimidine-DNA glycosylase